jgi:hypothetical protein
MGRKAKSMQGDPLQPHLKMHAPGLLSGMPQLGASSVVLGRKKCMESQRAFPLKSIGPCYELGIFL